jgi:hypothetical protein
MNTIIIDGRRELAELPEKWYTDGTDEANEWGKAVFTMSHWTRKFNYVGSDSECNANGTWHKFVEHDYITPSEFIRLVYEPWKEGVKLPTSYELLCEHIRDKGKKKHYKRSNLPAHINACIQLTNIMNFANDAFEGDGNMWEVGQSGKALTFAIICHPIRFTSKEGAE